MSLSAVELTLVLPVALGLLWAGWVFLRAGAQAGLMIATLILGGAATLYLTDARWFPAMRFGGAGPAGLAALGLIALQGALSVLVLWRAGGLAGAGPALRRLGWLRVLIFLGLTGLFAVSVQGYWGRFGAYAAHLVVEGGIAVIAVLNIAALVAVTPAGLRLPRLSPLLLAGVAFAASLAMGWFAFERLPHVEDELIYILQARGFAGGAASFDAPPEALRAGLDYYLLDIENGRWFATTPPGWTLVLALGELIGAPWLVNPLLIGLSVLLIHGVVTRAASREMADLVALLLATSPWALAMAGSLMGHTLALFLVLLAWWLLGLDTRTRAQAMAFALAAGLALGWLFATRQLEGVIIGVLTGLWLLRAGIAPGLVRAIPYGIGCLATGALYLAHNAAITGHALTAPLATYTSKLWGKGANGYGFGETIGPPEKAWGTLDLFAGHSPLEGLIYTANNIASLNFEMLGWATGALALVWVMALWGRWSRALAGAAGLVGIVIAVHFFYWFAGSFYIGPRYWYAALPGLLLLSAGGYMALAARLGAEHAAGLRLGLLALSLFSLLVTTTWLGAARYFEFRNGYSDLRDRLAQEDMGRALVFVKTGGDMAAVFMFNHMALPEDRPIFLRDLGPEANAAAAAAMPGRPVREITLR